MIKSNELKKEGKEIGVIREYNIQYGILIFILITFILIVVLNLWRFRGLVALGDFQYLVGTIISIIFTLKFRKPLQSPLKLSLIVGIIGGLLSGIAPSIYFWIVYNLAMYNFFLDLLYFAGLGLFFGFIFGTIIGYFYEKRFAKIKKSKENEFDYLWK